MKSKHFCTEADEKLSPSQTILSGLNPMNPETFSKGSQAAPKIFLKNDIQKLFQVGFVKIFFW